MCSGKDTLWEYLVSIGFLEPVQFAFADKVKEISEDLFKVDVVRKDDRARRVLQQVGASMREIESNVWIDYVLDEIVNKYNSRENYGITDVRHLNEADAIVEAGGRIILLTASEDLRKERLYIRDGIRVDDKTWQAWAQHPSEAEVDEIHQKYKDTENMVIIHQTSNDYEENYKKIVDQLKKKGWLREDDIELPNKD